MGLLRGAASLLPSLGVRCFHLLGGAVLPSEQNLIKLVKKNEIQSKREKLHHPDEEGKHRSKSVKLPSLWGHREWPSSKSLFRSGTVSPPEVASPSRTLLWVPFPTGKITVEANGPHRKRNTVTLESVYLSRSQQQQSHWGALHQKRAKPKD